MFRAKSILAKGNSRGYLSFSGVKKVYCGRIEAAKDYLTAPLDTAENVSCTDTFYGVLLP